MIFAIISDGELADYTALISEDDKGSASLAAQINQMIIQATLNLGRPPVSGESFPSVILGAPPSKIVQSRVRNLGRNAGWKIGFSGGQIALEGGCTMSLVKI